MNSSAVLIYGIGSGALGLVSGVFVRNMSYYWNRWGVFIGLIIFVEALVILPLLAAMVADKHNIILSAAMLCGFIYGLTRKKVR